MAQHTHKNFALPLPHVGNPGERRTAPRYPIRLELRYRLLATEDGLGARGTGYTADISSTGVLISTSQRLPVGKGVELSMAWPVLLNGDCPLNLFAIGSVVRAEAGLVAIRIHRYDFRTGQHRGVVTNSVADELLVAAGR